MVCYTYVCLKERDAMSKRTRGICKYCGKEYTKSGMVKHLLSCKERLKLQTVETSSQNSVGCFTIVIESIDSKDYWLVIEVNDESTLVDVDTFLRSIWLECCGHLSEFVIK